MPILPENYYKYAFFSAFTTIPGFAKPATFIESQISTIFSRYKTALREMRKSNDKPSNETEDDPTLYHPVPYCLFGDFDLAVFSLIDDFSFATKKFKPSADGVGFKYQINTGIIPLVQVHHENSLFRDFTVDKLPRFFTEQEKDQQNYPFTGIATIKLNSAILVGTGQDFLNIINFFLVTYLDKQIKLFSDEEGGKMIYIINENLGWNELTLYFFGNSMQKMQEILLSFRQHTLQMVKKHFQDLTFQEGFDVYKIQEEILSRFDEVVRSSLLSSLIGKADFDRMGSHPFLATSITYGYYAFLADYMEDKEKIMKKCGFKTEKEYQMFNSEANREMIKMAWNIKPGHEEVANILIKQVLPDDSNPLQQEVSSGKYPFTYPSKPISFRDYISFAQKGDKGLRDKINNHVVKFRSRLQFNVKVSYNEIDPERHYPYDLESFKLPKDVVSDAQNKLRVYPVPYIFKNQLENLIINFNDAVSDPLMYNYFIGLKPAIRKFLQENFGVTSAKERLPGSITKSFLDAELGDYDSDEGIKITVPPPVPPGSVKIDTISEFIHAWNKAYWNRYFHSYYFNEINDFNIEHHGGIQQILLTYDVLYRLISKRVYGDNCKKPFINVQIGAIITSTQFYCTVNFTHLFRPAVFACECVHEAVNHVLVYLVVNKGRKELGYLLNPYKDGVETDQKQQLDNMERDIREQLGPIDEDEVLYMLESFGLNSIRHLTADFLTYKLAYDDNTKSIDENYENIVHYYHTHWYIFLGRADLYFRDPNETGAWFFMEEEFKVLFVRLNLVFHLCLGFDEKELEKINEICPSVELKPLWESEMKKHINFVVRLGKAVKVVLDKNIKNPDIPYSDKVGIAHLMDMLDRFVLKEGFESLSEAEKSNYEKIIATNKVIIGKFSHLFVRSAGVQYNTIKRLAKNKEMYHGADPFGVTNVEFYKGGRNYDVFLDPKGNLFSTSPEVRKQIYKDNIIYIKEMWDLAMKMMIADYTDYIEQNNL